jgi:hypothetical protein
MADEVIVMFLEVFAVHYLGNEYKRNYFRIAFAIGPQNLELMAG